MKYFKIHPDVACCAYKHGVLHDKGAVYKETQWEVGDAIERVKKGFLIEVPSPTEAQEIKKDKEQSHFKDFNKNRNRN
jgi:hypothetical protein